MVCLFNDIQYEDLFVNAVGIFKIENKASPERFYGFKVQLPLNKKSPANGGTFRCGLLRILFLHDKKLAPSVLCMLLLGAVCTTVYLWLALTIALA